MPRTLHVVWSPQIGPMFGYWDPTKAWTHARTMLGVDVAQVEIREDLPEIVREDIDSDYDGDDTTPVEEVAPVHAPGTVDVDLGDLDDH